MKKKICHKILNSGSHLVFHEISFQIPSTHPFQIVYPCVNYFECNRVTESMKGFYEVKDERLSSEEESPPGPRWLPPFPSLPHTPINENPKIGGCESTLITRKE